MKYYAVKAGSVKKIIMGEWSEAEPEIRSLITGVSSPRYKGFKTEAEALKYLNEDEESSTNAAAASDNSGKAAEEAFEFTSDAVVFVDGSNNFDNRDFDGKKPNRTLNKKDDYYYASYGMIIFYRDGSVYVESAKLVDNKVLNDNETSYTSYRNGFTISKDNVVEKIEPSSETLMVPIVYQEKEFDNACLRTSWNISSELEAARRAIDICFNDRKLKNVHIFYDCESVSTVGKIFHSVTGKAKRPDLNSNITNFVGTYMEQLNDGERNVEFNWIPSHASGPVWAKFNDSVDILAKAETYNRPIGREENPNLKKEGVVPFKDKLTYSEFVTEDDVKRVTDARRQQAYEFIQKVVTNEAIKPKFK